MEKEDADFDFTDETNEDDEELTDETEDDDVETEDDVEDEDVVAPPEPPSHATVTEAALFETFVSKICVNVGVGRLMSVVIAAATVPATHAVCDARNTML